MFEKITEIIAIVLVIVGIIWAAWYENFAGKDAEPDDTKMNK